MIKLLRLTLILILFGVVSSAYADAFVSGMNQERRDYNFVRQPLSSVVETIISSSGYDIVYAVKDIDKGILITKQLKGVTIEQALTAVLSDNDLTYVIRDKNVIISKAAPRKVSPQKVDVSGRVLDAQSKKGVGYATITVDGTTVGTVSDETGAFKISVPIGGKLVVAFTGMKTKERVINAGDSRLFVELEGETFDVDEVIVTGYQRTSKSRTTGSVGVISAAELKGAPLNSIDMLMQGKIAGVNVSAVSGRPGETAKIRIRGTNTLSGNADPLWVVDGVMLQKDVLVPSLSQSNIKNGDFSTLFANGIAGINPSNIESITILKDAAAAAIYGSRAASGVIVVTTKRGKEGKTAISYSGGLSVTAKPVRNLSLMNSQEKLRFEDELWKEFSETGFLKGDYYPVIGITGMVRSGYGKFKGMSKIAQEDYLESLKSINTNWLDEIFRESISHNHDVNISGGTKTMDYNVSVGYGRTNGLVRVNSYDRYNLGSKLGFKLSDRVQLDFNTSLSYQTSKDASGSVDLFNYAYYANPYERPYDENGNFVADQTYFELSNANGQINNRIPTDGINILRELQETEQVVNNFSVTQSVSLNYNILSWLKFEGLGSLSYTNNASDNINGSNSYAAFSDRPFEYGSSSSQRKYGSISQLAAYNTSYSLRGQFSFDKTFGKKHHLGAVAGSEIQSQYAKSIFEKRYGYDPVTGNSSFPIYPGDDGDKIDYEKLISYAAIMDGLSGQGIDESAVASFYFQTQYSYSNRYTASLTARTDGSNNFGSKQQFNPIWSVGLVWHIRNEPFMVDKAEWLSTLSLRLSGGYTGNINKSVYPQFMMDYDKGFRKTSLEFLRMGTVGSAPNPNLRWERTLDYKASVDLGLFKDRLSIQIEAYNRMSNDVVTSVAVPSSTGFPTQSYNTSKILNQGLELTLSGTIVKGRDYSVNASVNGAYNNNVLVEYISPNGSTYGQTAVNYPLDAIFGGKYIGIDPFTGMYMFEPRKDAVLNEKKDYENGDNYLVYLGTKNAPVTGGYSLSGRYKNFTLSIGGNYSLGGTVINDTKSPAYYVLLEKPTPDSPPTTRNDLYVNHLNISKDAANRWKETNQITSGYPRLIDAFAPAKDYESYMTTSSEINKGAFLETISYFKINSISLSYNVAEKVVKRWGIENLSFSVIANNILTVSNYTGIDPETPGAIYPQSKSFSFSLNFGF